MTHLAAFWRRWAWAALAALAAGACADEELLPPEVPAAPIFQRYVSLGNSITAGVQSAGINDSTQKLSYAVLVAQRMGSPFEIPALDRPGCPPPLVNVFTQQTVAPGVSCALRSAPNPVHPAVSNVAVPGALVFDILSNALPEARPNPLTTFILGGRTQIEAARDARPTFASVWIGNNDVLGAAISGNAALVTPPNTFAARYDAMLDSLDALGLRGGALIGVVSVPNIPFLSLGAVYAQLQAGGQLPPAPLLTLRNCAPPSEGAASLIPFSYGFPKIAAASPPSLQPQTIDCLNDPAVLTPTESASISQAVAQYNQAIQRAAGARQWAYLDPNPALDSLRAIGQIPPFPNANFADPKSVTEPFGPWLSRDGIHPSTRAHRLIARKLIEAINAAYGTSLPLVTP